MDLTGSDSLRACMQPRGNKIILYGWRREKCGRIILSVYQYVIRIYYLCMYIYTREITGCLPLLNIRGGLLRLCGYGLHFLYVLHSTNSYIHKYILTNTKCIYENNPAFDHTLHESSNAFPMQRSYSDQFRICNIILLSKVQKHIYNLY